MLLKDDPHLREVLLEAADLPPDNRQAFLDSACGDDSELRREVQSLLERIDPSNGESVPARPAPAESHPDRIGRYRIIEPIGEGGMGTVYRAEQEHPVRRTVALKLIKLGMDTKQVVARFNAERQALAMMDHPHIARVFDAGATDTGRPYFVMELVEGVPITEYCDANRLSIRQRLELFVAVCQAVQHAHTKGVIHRDLKPSNVLVAQQDGGSVPKVIDFGIAKATQGRLTDQTLTTGSPQWMGTPHYMAPEQADGQGDVDTRGDIYSLGVLLYELLTGLTPFDFGTADYSQIQRIIREVDPPSPSVRLKTAVGAVKGVASSRATDAQKLRRLVRGELDWIVMRCLEKDRGRRYETASALAADVQRYLRHEPVTARHGGTVYRLGKLVRRNRLAFSSAAAVVLALSAGLVVSMLSLAHEADARQRAVKAEGEQSDLRWNAEHRAYASDMNLIQQALAVNNLGRARELLNRHRPKPGAKADLRGWEWRYLWQQCRGDAPFALFQGQVEIESLAVSPDSHYLAVGEREFGGLSVWDLRARRELARPPAGEYGVYVAFSPRGDLLAYTSVSTDAERRWHAHVHLWDVISNQVRATADLNEYAQGVAFSADGTTVLTSTAKSEGRLTLWKVPELTELTHVKSPQADDTSGTHLAVSPDLSAAAVSPNQGFCVFDLRTGKPRWEKNVSPEWSRSAAFSPDGRVIAFSPNSTGTIHLVDAMDGRSLGPPLTGHVAWVGQLVFWPDGRTLASCSADQTIRLWDVTDPAHVKPIGRPLRGHEHEVWRMALLPGQTILVTGDRDGHVCLWDLDAVKQKPSDHVMFPSEGWVFEQAGAAILSMATDGRILRRQGNDLLSESEYMTVGRRLRAKCSARPLGNRYMLAHAEDRMCALDLPARRTIREIPPIEGDLDYSAVTPDGHWIAFNKDSNSVREYDVRSGTDLPTWSTPGGPGGITAMTFTRELSLRLTLDYHGAGILADLTNGKQTSVKLAARAVYDACFSPDGSLVAATEMGRVSVWRTADLLAGRKAFPFVRFPFTLAAHSVAFSPDGKRLAAGGDDREAVKLYDVESQQELLTLSANGSQFQRTRFSADGSLLASSNDAGEVHVWRAPTWAEIDAAEAKQAN